MAEENTKILKTRIKMKTGTTSEWELATNFVPLKGEIIIYDDGNGAPPKFKVGDGVTLVGNLPFATTSTISSGGSFLFQPEEPENAEDGVVWIDTDEESNTINYVSYDAQIRSEDSQVQARDNISAAYDEIITIMSLEEYENLTNDAFIELYNRGVRVLFIEE